MSDFEIGDGVMLLYNVGGLREGTRGVVISMPLATTMISTGQPGPDVYKVLLDTGPRASVYPLPARYLFKRKRS